MMMVPDKVEKGPGPTRQPLANVDRMMSGLGDRTPVFVSAKEVRSQNAVSGTLPYQGCMSMEMMTAYVPLGKVIVVPVAMNWVVLDGMLIGPCIIALMPKGWLPPPDGPVEPGTPVVPWVPGMPWVPVAPLRPVMPCCPGVPGRPVAPWIDRKSVV